MPLGNAAAGKSTRVCIAAHRRLQWPASGIGLYFTPLLIGGIFRSEE